MAFAKKTWKDRISEYPTRRRLKKEDGTDEIVTVSREEGAISQEGDAFSAENMNNLEDRIDSEFAALNESLEEKVNSPTSINVLASWNANTYTTITLSDNISNYSFIIIGLRNNSSNVVFNSTTIPSDVFKNVSYSQGCRAYIAGNDIQATAHYLSDNSITAGGNALSSSYSGVIFGVK